MLEAFVHFIQAGRSSSDAVFDRYGNIIILRGSDFNYAIDPATYEAAREGARRGFVLHELRARFPGGGQQPSMEALIHIPLGNGAHPCPVELYLTSGMLPIAFEDLTGKCMETQMQIALVQREQHFYPRRTSGSRELASMEWVQAFSLE